MESALSTYEKAIIYRLKGSIITVIKTYACMKILFHLGAIFLLYFWSIPKVQSQSSVGVEVGYGFPWAGNEIPDGNITAFNYALTELKVIHWSFGAGRNYAVTFSHFFTSAIEAKCMISYLDGSTVHKTVKFLNSTSIRSYKANALWLSPTLVLNVGEKKVRPYAYAGFMFGVIPKIKNISKSTATDGTTESTFVYYGGPVYGISSGIGAKFYFKQNTKWYFSAEARFVSASFGPKKGELVRYYNNGTDELNSLSTMEKKTFYKSSFVRDFSVPENPNEPAIDSRRYYPFSSLGINVGVFYRL